MHIDDATRALTEEILRRSCERIGCANSALWLSVGDHLIPVLGSGPHASQFIGKYRHPLSEGIISMVHASGQPFCEDGIASNPHHSSRLDDMLGIQTHAMIALPVISADEIIGVITCVHTSPHGESTSPHSFQASDLNELEFAAAVCGRILNSFL
jgi:transcriptional regulator with GAF, ATPase, and Fis domain